MTTYFATLSEHDGKDEARLVFTIVSRSKVEAHALADRLAKKLALKLEGVIEMNKVGST